MGGLSEVAIQEALDALVRGDEELADRIIARDKKIDEIEMEVDKLSVRVIALRAPMADDLREVIAALKIAGVVERIGDYAKNIARRIGKIEERSEEHTSELQSLMRISYAVFCLKKKNKKGKQRHHLNTLVTQQRPH